jgi:WD40 repeat protein
LRTFRNPTGGVHHVAWHPGGRYVAWGSTDATIKLGDPATGEIFHTFRGHSNWVESVAFSPDGRWLVSASLDGSVKMWKAPSGPVPPSGEARNQAP